LEGDGVNYLLGKELEGVLFPKEERKGLPFRIVKHSEGVGFTPKGSIGGGQTTKGGAFPELYWNTFSKNPRNLEEARLGWANRREIGLGGRA